MNPSWRRRRRVASDRETPRVTTIKIFDHATDGVDVEAGTVLFREGDAGSTMIAVISGEVELDHAGHSVERVGPGGILGELALIDSSARSATATAVTAARVVEVDEREFRFLVQEHPTFALDVMRIMAMRLRTTTDAVHHGDD